MYLFMAAPKNRREISHCDGQMPHKLALEENEAERLAGTTIYGCVLRTVGVVFARDVARLHPPSRGLRYVIYMILSFRFGVETSHGFDGPLCVVPTSTL